jgi:hypothetical protein
MLLLVRHAHAGDKYRWQGPDSVRPLSAAGQAEAAGLPGCWRAPMGALGLPATCHRSRWPTRRPRHGNRALPSDFVPFR